MYDWLRYLWYEFVAVVGSTSFLFANSLRLEGFRNVPKEGPILVVANHQSYLDPVLVGLAVRRHLTFLARSSLFRNSFFAFLIRSLNAVPVNQEGFAREGLQTILEELRQDKAVLVFPEGERTDDGTLHEMRPGVHLLIKRVDMQILPVGIAGAYEAWPRHQLLPHLAPLPLPASDATLAVSVGKPIASSALADLPREEVLKFLFVELQKVQMRAEELRRRD